ncbi:hypothetical protein O0L34_g13183 [Tuta absoluta]|nr:hypothetical protein O0L34_g13183 [Tuta absoluta]
MDSTSQLVRMITFNCKNIKTSLQQVRDMCVEADLVALQETWLMTHDLDIIDSINAEFSCVAKSSMDTSMGVLRGRPYGGIALMWRKSKFPNVAVVDCGSDRLIAIRITKDKRSFMVFCVYLPCDKLDNLPEFTDCLARMHAIVEESDCSIVYMLGDYNAHPYARFGAELKLFCEEHDFVCADIDILGVDSDTHTFVSDAHGSRTWLDHCLTTVAGRDTLVSAKVMYGVYSSDHLPLRVECNIDHCTWLADGESREQQSELAKIRWGNRDASQIESYFNYCNKDLIDINSNTCSLSCYGILDCNCNCLNCTAESGDYHIVIDTLYHSIVKTLQSCASKSSCLRPPKRNKRKPVTGWNFHVAQTHSVARLHYECWLVAGKPSTGDIHYQMILAKKVFKNKLKWCIRNEETIKMDILAIHRKEKNFPKFWNATKKLQNKQSLPVSVDGLQKPREIADIFRSKFQISPKPVEKQHRREEIHSGFEQPVVRFTENDVAKAVRGMKRGKSPGHDGLSIEHVLYAGEMLWTKLCVLYNLCVKHTYLPDSLMKTIVVPIVKSKTGDLGSSSNYRPISLGTVIGKILERLLQPELLKNVEIDEAQFGFRSGVSTDSAIASLKHTVDYYVERETSVYACFLDLSRAFDLVNYDILWNKLHDSGVPEHIVGILRHWYGGQTNYVRWSDTTSNAYKLECGVRQGGLTSPDLFNIYVNGLIGELRSTGTGCHIDGVCVNNISYADDMVLLSPSISGLKKLLLVCENYANSHGLKYNVAKTEMLVFRAGKGPQRVPEVFLNGSAVRTVKQFKYLGHIVTEDRKDDLDMERERRALSVRCNMLARRFAKCSKQVKDTLFRAYCQCFYTCQLWYRYRRVSFSTIRVQYNDAYRILMKLPRYCSASGMFAEAGVPDFFAVMRARTASFWERLRSSGNSILQLLTRDLTSPMIRHWIAMHRDANKK